VIFDVPNAKILLQHKPTTSESSPLENLNGVRRSLELTTQFAGWLKKVKGRIELVANSAFLQ